MTQCEEKNDSFGSACEDQKQAAVRKVCPRPQRRHVSTSSLVQLKKLGLLCFALLVLAASLRTEAALFVKGTATGKRPPSKLKGQTNQEYVVSVAFSMLISQTNARMDLRIERPYGRPLEGVVYDNGQTPISYHSKLPGEAQFGPSKGHWESMAYIQRNSFQVFTGWENFVATAFFPFWHDRFPLESAARIPDFSGVGEEGRYYHHLQLVNDFPRSGSEIRLFLDASRIRERWIFLEHTEVAGVAFPVKYRREIFGRPQKEHEFQNPTGNFFFVWEVNVDEIRQNEPEPTIPELNGTTLIEDHRLTQMVNYITTRWLSVSDLMSETNVLAQLRPDGRSILTRSSIVVSRDNNPSSAAYIILAVFLSIIGVGAVRLSSKNRNQIEPK